MTDLAVLGAESDVERSREVVPWSWANRRLGEDKAKVYYAGMDEGRKCVIGVMAAILASLHMLTADDLFGGPQGSPRTDRLIAASIQWAERIMTRIDDVFGK